MTKQEFSKGLTLIGKIFNKQYSQIELSIYYDIVKDYSNEVWESAISLIIKTEKYAPKPVDLIRALEDIKKSTELPIIELMIKDGYFKRPDINLKRYQLELEQLKADENVSQVVIDEKEKQIEEELQRMSRDELHAIEKAKMFIIKENIPEWLLADMRKYYTKQLTTQKLLN